MKAILTGSTGYIGGEILKQCVENPDISSIVVLSRRPLVEPAAICQKVKTLVVTDFLRYTDSVLSELGDADFCIWALGSHTGGDEIQGGFPLAFCDAVVKARVAAPSKLFRMVYLSGMGAVIDQEASLWWLPVPRKAKGWAETRLLAFCKEQNKDHDGGWDMYVVRPGGVAYKQATWIMTCIFGASLFMGVDVLAKAMIATSLEGHTEKKMLHLGLIEKGSGERRKGE